MDRFLRPSLAVIALSFLFSIGTYYAYEKQSSGPFFVEGGTVLAYVLIAVLWRSPKPRRLLYWLVCCACAFPVVIAMVQVLFFPKKDAWLVDLDDLGRWWDFSYAVLLLLVLAGIVWAALRGSPRSGRLATWCMVLGSALILASLFLPMTFPEDDIASAGGHGLSILLRHEQWVTAFASPGQSAFLGGRIAWLQPIFPAAGYAFYIVTIFGAIGCMALLVAARFSSVRLANSHALAQFAAISALATSWLLTDIFWGWNFNFSDHLATALLATVSWAAMTVCAAIPAFIIAHRPITDAHVSWLRLVQVPMIAFNLFMMRAYFEHGSYTPFSGLATLLVGLPLLSWSSQQLLLSAIKDPVLTIGSPAEPLKADACCAK